MSRIGDCYKNCTTHVAAKRARMKSRGCMRRYNVGTLFERIALDIAEPFPIIVWGNIYISMVMDYFSTWAETFTISNQEAVTVAEMLVNEWISSFGILL